MKALKWLVIVLALGVLAMAGVALALQQWLRTDDFRRRVEQQAAQALGVPLQMGKLSVEMWPLPGVAADGLRIGTSPPITIARIEARPVWASLLAGEVDIATLIVEEAVLPQAGVNALAATLQKRAKGAEAGKKAQAARGMRLPRNVQLRRLTWADAKQRITIAAGIELGSDGLLDVADFKVLEGRLAGASGSVKRNGDDWPVRVKVGGGTITGNLQMKAQQAGALLLTGRLATEGVEVAALTAPSRTLTGKLQAQTTLRAEFREIGQLGDALATQSQFTVHDALIQGIDLAKAVETVGLSRGGSTRLNTLTGQVNTQGQTVRVTKLVANSGALSATGNVTMFPNRSLDGRVTVDLVTSKGALAVPLAVSGTADSPSVMLTREAMVGAAIGTVLAPGVGTGAGASAGARFGDKVRGLFGK